MVNISTSGQVVVTVTFSKEEGWTAYNDRKLPFHVRQLLYSGGKFVQLNGWCIRIDGSHGDIQRYGRMKVEELSDDLREQIGNTYTKRLVKLLQEVGQ